MSNKYIFEWTGINDKFVARWKISQGKTLSVQGSFDAKTEFYNQLLSGTAKDYTYTSYSDSVKINPDDIKGLTVEKTKCVLNRVEKEIKRAFSSCLERTVKECSSESSMMLMEYFLVKFTNGLLKDN